MRTVETGLDGLHSFRLRSKLGGTAWLCYLGISNWDTDEPYWKRGPTGFPEPRPGQ